MASRSRQARYPRVSSVAETPADPRQSVVVEGRVPLIEAFRHTGIYALHLQSQASLGTFKLRQALKLPRGIHEDEWIAMHTINIFDDVYKFVTMLTEGMICFEELCPKMSAGQRVCYAWEDENTGEYKQVTAKEYMLNTLFWGEEILRDRKMIPLDIHVDFPPEFMPFVRKLHKRMFRVFAHAYLHHFEVFREGDNEAHLNYVFKHQLYLCLEFNLLEEKDMLPLRDLINNFVARDRENDKGKTLDW